MVLRLLAVAFAFLVTLPRRTAQGAAPADPRLEIELACTTNLTATVTITDSGAAMPSPGTCSIFDPVSNQTTMQSFQLGAGGSLALNVAGNAMVTVQYTSGGAPFVLVATASCEADPGSAPPILG
jgi:hypothetical protein